MKRYIFSAAALMLVQFPANSAGFPVFAFTMGAGGRRWLSYEPDCRDGLRRIESLRASITNESMLFRRMEHSCKQIFKQSRVQASPHFLARMLHTLADLTLVRRRKAARAMETLAETLRYIFMQPYRHRVHHKVSGPEELGGIASWDPAIEKIRLGGRFWLRLEAGPAVGLPGIRALVRMPFVENAIPQALARKGDGPYGLRRPIEFAATGCWNSPDRRKTVSGEGRCLSQDGDGAIAALSGQHSDAAPEAPGSSMIRAVTAAYEASARSRRRGQPHSSRLDSRLVGEAEDGLSAIEQGVCGQPAVVLLDVQMPGLNRLEVLSALPAEARRPLAIFLTCFGVTCFDQPAPAASEAEAEAYLLKPMQEKRLLAVMNRIRRLLLNQTGLALEAERIDRV